MEKAQLTELDKQLIDVMSSLLIDRVKIAAIMGICKSQKARIFMGNVIKKRGRLRVI